MGLLIANLDEFINNDESTVIESFEDFFDSKEEYEKYFKKYEEFGRQQNYNAGIAALAAQELWIV